MDSDAYRKCAICGGYFDDGELIRAVTMCAFVDLGDDAGLGEPEAIEEITHIYCRGSVN
jgi:hypothetical protein